MKSLRGSEDELLGLVSPPRDCLVTQDYSRPYLHTVALVVVKSPTTPAADITRDVVASCNVTAQPDILG